MGDDTPRRVDRAACRTAIKLLREYERLANKLGKQIPPARLAELDRKRDAGTITSADLPGWAQVRFPGEFDGTTLDDIRTTCIL